MAEPARRSAAGLAAPGWGDVRRQMIAAAKDVAAAVSAYLADGGAASSPAAVKADRAIAAFLEHGETARHLEVGETVIEMERARAVEEDRASRPRPPGRRLRAVT